MAEFLDAKKFLLLRMPQESLSLTGVLRPTFSINILHLCSHLIMVTCDTGDPSNGSSDMSFTPAKVIRVLRALKPKNSCVPDGFPCVLLKKMASVLCEPLAFISCHPVIRIHCRLASVTPVFKKGLTANHNYLPVSLTCVCCCLLERNSKLLSYLSQHGLISKCQHRFLCKHSTCTNLWEFVHDWSIALNNKQITDVIHIDFQKAFDSVSRQKLIIKLEGYGICGDAGVVEGISVRPYTSCKHLWLHV